MPETVMPHVTGSTSKVGTTNRKHERRWYDVHMNGEGSDGFSDSESSSDESEGKKATSTVSGNHSIKTLRTHPKLIKNGINDRKHASARIIKHRSNSIEEKKKTAEKEQHRTFNEEFDNNSKSENEEIINYTFKDLQPLLAGQSKEDEDVPIMTPPPIPEPPPKFSFQIPNSAIYARPFSLSFLHAGDKLKCGFDEEVASNAKGILTDVWENRKSKECHCSGGCAGDNSVAGWERTEKSGKGKGGKKRKVKHASYTSTFLRLTGVLNSDKDDPVAFQYYEDSKKYIERYRFFHAVGNICRPRSEGVKIVVPVKKDIENEPYFKNFKTQCAMATDCDLYSLITKAKSKRAKQEVKRPSSEPTDNSKRKSIEEFQLKLGVLAWCMTKNSQSSGSGNGKNKSEDEDSNEDESVEAKPFSMKDRGKTLNLAPVRECMVPELIPTDKLEQYQQNYIELNQYLNLMTPPAPGKNLQFQIDELKDKRFGNRIINTGENNLFPACTPRRGARPLRLGSAEFVKPGSGDLEPKWSNDIKPPQPQSFHRATTFHSSTVPGNLIVGSTVTQSNHSAKARPRISGKTSPYITFSKEQSINFTTKPQTPPHHIFGKKFKPCERVQDLTSSKERMGRLSYSHSPNNNNNVNDKMTSPCRTVMAVDLKDSTGLRREKVKQITLDVNHLGIRGRTFQQEGQIAVLYKDRRTATVKS